MQVVNLFRLTQQNIKMRENQEKNSFTITTHRKYLLVACSVVMKKRAIPLPVPSTLRPRVHDKG